VDVHLQTCKMRWHVSTASIKKLNCYAIYSLLEISKINYIKHN
jgi:hypothetical protein